MAATGPRGKQGKCAEESDKQRVADQMVCGLDQGGSPGDSDTEKEGGLTRSGPQRHEAKEPRHSVEPRRVRCPLPTLDDCRDNGRLGLGLAHPSVRIGEARQDRPLTIEDGDG